MISDESKKNKITTRSKNFENYKPVSSDPLFPKTILVEISNVCNHRCVFCAYSKMTRKSRAIDLELMKSLLRKAYDLGAREGGFYSSAEPFASPHLEEIIRLAHDIGYEYIFITTNGSLATEERLRACIDNGLNSIKFSINGGDRQTYRTIHGKDHFDLVLRHVRFVSEYRKLMKKNIYLGISSVKFEHNGYSNARAIKNLRTLAEPLADEFIVMDAVNQSGQMTGLKPYYVDQTCVLPFARAHISAEGYLRMCCNDYQNYLALADLNKTALEDAWHSEVFKKMRGRHLAKDLKGTLCHNCIHGVNTPIEPVVPELATRVEQDHFDFQLPDAFKKRHVNE